MHPVSKKWVCISYLHIVWATSYLIRSECLSVLYHRKMGTFSLDILTDLSELWLEIENLLLTFLNCKANSLQSMIKESSLSLVYRKKEMLKTRRRLILVIAFLANSFDRLKLQDSSRRNKILICSWEELHSLQILPDIHMEGGFSVGKRRHRSEFTQAFPLRPFFLAGVCKGGQGQSCQGGLHGQKCPVQGTFSRGYHPFQGPIP